MALKNLPLVFQPLKGSHSIKSFDWIFSDIDECNEVAGTCDHGYCSNSIGGFSCTCELGFQQDKTKTKCVGKYFLSGFLFPI